MKLPVAIIFVAVTVMANAQNSSSNYDVPMPFGKHNKIVYHVYNGTYDVFFGDKKIISSAYAETTLADNYGTLTINTKQFDNRIARIHKINDAFGKGNCFEFTVANGSKAPAVTQQFYVYPNHEFFFTQLVVEHFFVSTNYMAPLVCDTASIYGTGDNRTLFVPFDNDTFISYNAISMNDGAVSDTSAEVGAVYDDVSRKGLITGSIEHGVWKTGVHTAGKGSELSALKIWAGYTSNITRDNIAHGTIKGDLITSPKIFVGYFNDWRQGMEEFGKANRIADPPYIFNWNKPTPVGWNSWGVIQSKLNYNSAVKVVDFFADSLPAFRNGDTAFVDLDSYWDNITGGMKGDYTKLKAFADYCLAKGLQPGVYWAPFTDWGWKSKNDRTAEGSGYKFSQMWTKVNSAYHDLDGGRAIDPTHPGTQQRIAFIIGQLKACGFKMIKIDFLGHAAIEADKFYDSTVTTGMQAYRKGMEFLINQLGSQMLVYAAISPSLATGRYAHMRRIACDAFKTIKDTRYTLNSVNYGWWQSFVYKYIDADHIVFGTESEGANRVRLTSALVTGSLITGDDYSAEGPWKARAKQWLQDKSLLAIIHNGVAFMPVHANTGDSANELFVRKIGAAYYLAVFNYSGGKKQWQLPFSLLNIPVGKYAATELFTKAPVKINTSFSIELGAEDAAMIKISVVK